MRTPQERAEEFTTTARRLEHERQLATTTVEPLLRSMPREDWPALVEHPDLQTIGAIERLGHLFTYFVDRDPAYALSIAELAVSLSEAIPSHLYPSITIAQTKAFAWKDLGKVHLAQNRHHDALEALWKAEAYCTNRRLTLAHELAGVRFTIAITFQEIGRFDDSRKLLAECRATYEEYEDTPKIIMCGIAEGVLLQRLSRFREAREIYLLVLASHPEMDLSTLASVNRAIGLCSIELGDFADAEATLKRSATIFRELGNAIELLNSEAARGRLSIRRGTIDEGIRHLRPIRRQFLTHGMAEEAGICGLEIVQGLLVRQRFSEAEKLARIIIRQFTDAALNQRAISALGFLSEAIEGGKATPRLAQNVRLYVVSLRTSPERDFEEWMTAMAMGV